MTSSIRLVLLITYQGVLAAGLLLFLSSCKPDSQPRRWARQVERGHEASQALRRLDDLFSSTLVQADDNAESSYVKALVNEIIQPLTHAYVANYEDLSFPDRAGLISLLSSFRDRRAELAFRKAIDEFTKKQEGIDIKWALAAITRLRLENEADLLPDVLMKTRISTPLGGLVRRDLKQALLSTCSKSCKSKLVKVLSSDGFRDSTNSIARQDEVFRQSTAAKVIGELGDATAVYPLFRILLDPAQADVHPSALIALARIGNPSDKVAIALLKGDQTVSYATTLSPSGISKNSQADSTLLVEVAVRVLAAVGRSDALDAVIDAIRNERDEKKKAIIALELPKISNSLETKKVFEDVLDSISIGTSLQSGEDLKTTLAAESSRFYDPTMIDWLLGQARNNAGILVRTYEILCHKDSPFGTGMSCYPRQRIIDDIEIRLRKRTFGGTIAKNILRLARPSQLELAKSAVETYIVRGPGSIVFVRIGGVSSYAEGLNDPSGRKEYELVAELLKECEEQPKCYIAALLEKKNHNKDRRIVAIKSAYMAAILGDKETRDALVGILGTFEEPEVKIEIARAIDHLSRNGSKTTALLLRKILEEQSGSRGAEYAEADAIIAEVAARLDARED